MPQLPRTAPTARSRPLVGAVAALVAGLTGVTVLGWLWVRWDGSPAWIPTHELLLGAVGLALTAVSVALAAWAGAGLSRSGNPAGERSAQRLEGGGEVP